MRNLVLVIFILILPLGVSADVLEIRDDINQLKSINVQVKKLRELGVRLIKIIDEGREGNIKIDLTAAQIQRIVNDYDALKARIKTAVSNL